jgi:hypothetical protein
MVNSSWLHYAHRPAGGHELVQDGFRPCHSEHRIARYQILFKLEVKPAEILRKLHAQYGEETLSRTDAYNWYFFPQGASCCVSQALSFSKVIRQHNKNRFSITQYYSIYFLTVIGVHAELRHDVHNAHTDFTLTVYYDSFPRRYTAYNINTP